MAGIAVDIKSVLYWPGVSLNFKTSAATKASAAKLGIPLAGELR
jgi:hypothetical protein